MQVDDAMRQCSDEELVARINSGNVRAFDALCERYRDWVYAVAWRRVQEREAALDIMQEAFLYLLRKFPGFELQAPLKALLYPVVHHLARDDRAKSARQATVTLDPAMVAADGADVIDSDLADALRRALADLSPEHRETLLLRYVDGLSVAHTAEATGVPEGTVKSRLHHALAVLRSESRISSMFD